MEHEAAHILLEQLAKLVNEFKEDAATEITVPLDLMERILTEGRDLIEQFIATHRHLMQSEKMTMLGNLMAGIAHEIGTPVASINSNIDLFARSLDRIRETLNSEDIPEEVRRNRQIARAMEILENLNQFNKTACDRILQIVRSLRNSIHGDIAELREVNIHEELENALILTHHELKRRITVIREYGEIPLCTCYSSMLSSVFVNMIINASQAIKGTGEIRIKTTVEDNIIIVKFTDTGEGIPPENLEKLFVPGFTTKSPDEGTGLGLAICSRIMEKHNGRIEVESEVGKGTTFTIYLPVKQDDTQCCNIAE